MDGYHAVLLLFDGDIKPTKRTASFKQRKTIISDAIARRNQTIEIARFRSRPYTIMLGAYDRRLERGLRGSRAMNSMDAYPMV